MTQVLTAPRTTDGSTDSPPPILHWVDPKRPTHARCGKKLVEIVGPIGEAECVVCEALKRADS